MAKKQQQQQKHQKHQKPKQKPTSTTSPPAQSLQLEASDVTDPSSSQDLQQRLLDIFAHAFHHVLSSDSFAPTVRDVKQALFDRDFDAAFGREEYLAVYAARWSPTRALCYAAVLDSIAEHLHDTCISRSTSPSGHDEPEEAATLPAGCLRMLSMGGCAAEHVALASYLLTARLSGSLTLLDSGPWSAIAALLQERITSPPLLSKFASAAAKAADKNKPLLSERRLRTEFLQQDVLSMSQERLAELSDGKPLLVTLMFTLNELYTNRGIGKTTTFLKMLGDAVPEGSLLLVVDSPGSYSEAAVGKERSKRYPMQWLLDLTLLQVERGSARECKWRKLESQESVWFRLPEGLAYPIQLENMRYQMHLYRREDVPR